VGYPPELSDADGTAVVGTAAPVTPDGAVLPTAPTQLDRVRVALARVTSRQVLGWVLVIGWVVWLTALWVTQPRLVPQSVLDDDLASGRGIAYRLVTVDEDQGGPASGPHRIDVYPASDDQDGVVDAAADGQPITVAYWVDSPVGGLRVLDPNGLSSNTTAAVVGRLAAAGVPEAAASVLYRGTAADRVNQAGVLLLAVSSLVVIFGPRPRRGTRWFWFWVVGGPLSVGVPIFAAAELIRPRYELAGTEHPPGVAGRWSGLTGFAMSFLLALAGAAALLALNAVSPVWFIRG
jgi:hypothetical protein